MGKIKVALIGLGNCASALLQGITYYQDRDPEGVMTPDIGGYKPSDIEVVTAFDVNANKIGLRIDKAVQMSPNNAYVFANVHNENPVQPGVVLDSMADYQYHDFALKDGLLSGDDWSKVGPKIYHESYELEDQIESVQSVVRALKESEAEVAVNYLPVGSRQASRFYAYCCLCAGVNFINAMPEFIATEDTWIRLFRRRRLVIAGDDVKSQVGATVVHRALTHLVEMRGQKISNTYQLNFGGNTDFENMLDRTRLETKEKSKTQAVTSLLGNIPEMKVGPSDFVHYLDDKKICYINIKGEQFGGAPFNIEVKLEVEDSPNSAGVIFDAIRGVKLAHDQEEFGYCDPVSSWCFKSPRDQVPDLEAKNIFHQWSQPAADPSAPAEY